MDQVDNIYADMSDAYLRLAYQVFFSDGKSNDFFNYLKNDLRNFLVTRDNRVKEIMSGEVKEALRLQEALMTHRRYHATLCMDSRVTMKLLGCLLSLSVKTPAGKFDTEYLPLNNSDKLVLMPDGVMAKIISKELAASDVLVEILVSHVGCAAAEKIAQDSLGLDVVCDHGLLLDMERKIKMGEAIVAHVKKYYPKKRALIFHICFNPENGYSYYGLHDCLRDSAVEKEGFTAAVLDQLVRAGRILYTKVSAEDMFFREFSKHYFPCNYSENYAQNTLDFWANMFKIVPKIIEHFEDKIRSLVACSNQDDLRQLSVLLIASAYNGFLHNFNEKLEAVKYPYSTHTECCVTVTTDGKGPYPNGMVAFSLDTNSPRLSQYIVFGRDLVFKNRRENRVVGYHNGLSRSPVLVFLFRRIKRDNGVEAKKIRQIDWRDLVNKDWYNMSDAQFYEYLLSKIPDLSLDASEAINKLRLLAKKLYTPGEASAEYLLNGRMIPVWILADQNRSIINIFPFLMNGY